MPPHTSCHRCRFPNTPANSFCGQCGAPLQPATTRGGSGLPSELKVLLIVLGAVGAALYVIAAVMSTQRVTAPQSARWPQASVAGNSASQPPQAADKPPTISNTERLDIAKRFMKGGGRLDLDNAEDHLNHIPPGIPEYKEAQALLKKVAAQRAPLLREELAADYQAVVSNANLHLNYIDKKLTKTKGGFALWATHEYFSQYTLSIGNDAHVISAWIDGHRDELKEAGIARVGVMGRGEFASWSYFDIK